MTQLFHVFDMTAPYALGALSPEDQLVVREHIAACEPCRVELAEMQNVVGMLPLACETAQPDDELKRRLVAAAQGEIKAKTMLRRRSRTNAGSSERPVEPGALWRYAQYWLTAAAGLAAIVAVFIAMNQSHERERMAHALAQATARVTALEAANSELAAKAEHGHDVMASLATGSYWEMGRGQDATGRTWHSTVVQPMDENKNGMAMASVPNAPKGMTYQLWVVRNGQAHSAGTIQKGGMTIMDLPMPLRKGDIVAFSMEHGAGTGIPTRPFLLETTI
jgi:anti-sigma factor RsiW